MKLLANLLYHPSCTHLFAVGFHILLLHPLHFLDHLLHHFALLLILHPSEASSFPASVRRRRGWRVTKRRRWRALRMSEKSGRWRWVRDSTMVMWGWRDESSKVTNKRMVIIIATAGWHAERRVECYPSWCLLSLEEK